MTLPELVALSPLIVVAVFTMAVLLLIAARRSHQATCILTLVGLVAASAALVASAASGAQRVTSLLVVDRYSLYYMGLIFAAAFAVAALSYGYLEGRSGEPEEFYVLLLLATLGSGILVASTHFASFFLGLEILSVSLYTLIAYPRTERLHIEAGLKYLILAATSAAFLLFGMALIYSKSGRMDLAGLAATVGATHSPIVLAGLGMLVVGIGYKLALVPFHLWTPDVYQGAPAPVTAFVATVSKGSMFALLLRFFPRTSLDAHNGLVLVFALMAVASMIAGNVLALLQDNVKRLLAYSSIAHLGYLLVAFLASGALAATAVAFYLAAYFVAMLGALGVVTVLSGKEGDAGRLEDYRGLARQRPWLAGAFTAMLFSLAGIPLTAGFVGKFYLVMAGIGSALWLLVFVLVVTSAIGLFYYLRVIAALYQAVPASAAAPVVARPLPLLSALVLAALTVALIGLGTYPAPLLDWIRSAVGT
ncbi:MAG TPA: NADH-quinone oxidoreductase subunit N [Armatimonadota bacterium]|jgi:NADH-quinone oxidoreductase subunit N